MLHITVPATDLWDESTNSFISTKEQVLNLEHSLVSLSKWESKWNKPFLRKEEKTSDEILYYVKCMTLNQNVDPNVYLALTQKNLQEIVDYIKAPMTATWFSEDKNKNHSKETVTSELIYYWMIALNIPVEFQKWHLNRLLTLIRVCNIKNEPPKKMSKRALMSRNTSLNQARRQAMNSRG